MSEQTDIIAKIDKYDSTIFGVSVRAWLVLEIVTAVVLIHISNFILACLGYTSMAMKIEEPLYSGFMIALGYYFGQKDQKKP